MYLGEDAGTSELHIYDNGTYKLATGGILGVTNKHFGNYHFSLCTIVIETKDDMGCFTGYKIEINSKEYSVECE